MSFDREADDVAVHFPAGPRLVVVGSTSFYGPDSFDITLAIAGAVASIDKLVIITGGMAGVGYAFSREIAERRRNLGIEERLFHLLPRHSPPGSTGVTLHAGSDFYERREVLGRVANVYLSIEGGPGTEHEAEVAIARGAAVIPVARTGGCSAPLHARLQHQAQPCPDWDALRDATLSVDEVSMAVRRLIASRL